MFCPRCHQIVKYGYDTDLDIAYLNGQLTDQLVRVECSNKECSFETIIPYKRRNNMKRPITDNKVFYRQ